MTRYLYKNNHPFVSKGIELIIKNAQELVIRKQNLNQFLILLL